MLGQKMNLNFSANRGANCAGFCRDSHIYHESFSMQPSYSYSYIFKVLQESGIEKSQ